MELNLLPVLNCEGKRLPVDVSFEIESRQGDLFRILSPVVLKGQVVNIGGCLEFEAKGSATLEFMCDRCCDTFSEEVVFNIEEKFKKEESADIPQENPDITVIVGNVIDLDEIAYDGLALSMPSKILCSEDCKGLCANCGKNLNEGQCECDTRPIDPRFDILDKLL